MENCPQLAQVLESSREQVRERILNAALALLAAGGRDAVTTRAIASAANVQAPTIYRIFGDKSRLLDAVAEQGFMAYFEQKQAYVETRNPVEDLRMGWNRHVEFGLTHPALYALMYGEPRPGVRTPAATTAYQMLESLIKRIAAAGRLRVSEERAAYLVHASGCGAVLALLALPEDSRNPALAAAAREAVIAAITNEPTLPDIPGPLGAAAALRARLPEVTALSENEQNLLRDWLDRIVQAGESK